jgi:hypothetical protein
LKEQGITVSSKKALDMFRAVMGFHGAPATLAERICQRTNPDSKQAVFKDIPDRIHAFKPGLTAT